MGFWYYCQEKCCGASAYSWAPKLGQYGGGDTFDNGFGSPPNTVDGRPPLQGSPPSITKQSDGWVLLRGNYGIRDDGSLWGAINGSDKLLFLDAGPWTWVSQDPTNSSAGVGIKDDGSLWTWNLPVPGDKTISGWGRVYGQDDGLRAHVDLKMTGVVGLDTTQLQYSMTSQGNRTLTPSGLGATLFGCEPNEGGNLKATVARVFAGYIGTSPGGFSYSSPPAMTFDPPGASATAHLAGGRIAFVEVTKGGTYSYNPKVRFTGTNASGSRQQAARATLELDAASAKAAFTPHIEKASVYYVEVTSGGSGYSLPPVVTFSPSGASAQAVLKNDGSVAFIQVTSGGEYSAAPTVTVARHPSDTAGGGCTATAHIEGYVSSVTINDEGSYTQRTFGQPQYEVNYNAHAIQAWCDPPSCAGHVYGVKLTASGSNYLAPVAPQVAISGRGSGATAEATVNSNGVVTSVSVTGAGSGYWQTIASVQLTNSGSGYTHPPIVSFSPASTASATAVLNQQGKVAAIVVAEAGRYGSTPPTVTVTNHPDDTSGGGCAAVAILSPPPTVSFAPTGAVATATVAGDPFGIESIAVVSGGAYMLPTPPTVTLDSKIGAGAVIKATVADSGGVNSLYVYSHGSGYDPEDPDKAVPEIPLKFTAPTNGIGSGAEGVAYVISKYRHPSDDIRKYYDSSKQWTGFDTLRMTVGNAVMSTGGIHSITLEDPIRIEQTQQYLGKDYGWDAPYVKAWRIDGGDGVITKTRGRGVEGILAVNPASLGKSAKYEGESGGQTVAYSPATVFEISGASVTNGGTGYEKPPLVTLSLPQGVTELVPAEFSVTISPSGFHQDPSRDGSQFAFYTSSDGMPVAWIYVTSPGLYEAPESANLADVVPSVVVTPQSGDETGAGCTATVSVRAVHRYNLVYPEVSAETRPPAVHRLSSKPADQTITFAPDVIGRCRTESERDFVIIPHAIEVPVGSKLVSLEQTKPLTASYEVYDGTETERTYCYDYDEDGIIDPNLECETWWEPNYVEVLSVTDVEYPEYTLTKSDNRYMLTPDKVGTATVGVQNLPADYTQNGGTAADIPITEAGGWYVPTTVFGPQYKAKLTGEWYVSEIASTKHPGDFRPAVDPLPTLACAVPRTQSEGGADQPVISATLGEINGAAAITGFTLSETERGSGFRFEPNINYSHNPHGLAFDIRQVGTEKGWTNAEMLYGACVAIKNGELYWWGSINYGPPDNNWWPDYGIIPTAVFQSWWAPLSYVRTADIVAHPVRVGNSAIAVQAEVPPDSIRATGPMTFEVGPPDTGWAVSVSGNYNVGGTATGRLSSPFLYDTTHFFDIGAFSHSGSLGYTSEPTIAYHGADESDPLRLSVEVRGPDGEAAMIVPPPTGGTHQAPTASQFSVIDKSGAVWAWSSAYRPGSSATVAPILASQKSAYVASSTDDGTIIKNNLCDEVSRDAYAISVSAPGSGYKQPPSLAVTTTSVSFQPIPYEPEDATCGGGVVWHYYDPNAGTSYGSKYTEECADYVTEESKATYGLFSLDRHGRVVSGIGAVLYSTSEPSFSVSATKGSGFSADATKLDSNITPGGWEKCGRISGEAVSFVQSATGLAITKTGDVKRGLARLDSAFAGKDLDNVVSLSIDGKAAWEGDGTLLVTDSIHAWVQGGIELTVTGNGAGMELPPQAKLKADLSGVASATAKINGKVVAFGVIEKGSGYTEQPTVTVKASTVVAGGSGAEGTAHICGPVDLLEVTNKGSGYRVPPLVTFSRPGMPAKSVTHAAGGVAGVSLTYKGTGYSAPPAVSFSGDGSGAVATAQIKGYVDSIAITAQGSGYSKAPDVQITGGGGSGATAVAFVDAGKLVAVEVTKPGTGYTSAPTVAFTGNAGSGAAAQATIKGGVESVQVTEAGTGYTAPPDVLFYPEGAKAAASVSMSVTSAELTSGGRYWNTPPTVTVAPDYTIESITVKNGGSGYTTPPQVLVVGGTGKGAAAKCTISGKVATIDVVAGGIGYSKLFPPAVTIAGGIDPVAGKFAEATVKISDGGVVESVTVSNQGSGYISQPTVSLRWPAQATAVAEVDAGKVTAVNIVNKGAFYMAAPTVVFDGDGGAKATATIQDGSVSSITVDEGGDGYSSPPAVTLAYDTGGAGAVLSATIDAAVDSVIVTSPGADYRYPPQVLFIGGGGSGAEAEANTGTVGSGCKLDATINGCVEYIELTKQGSDYQFPPTVEIDAPEGAGGTKATAQARILGKISSFTIVDGGSGYSKTTVNQAIDKNTMPGTVATRPCQAIAMVHGVGYDAGKEYVAFGAGDDGVVAQAPTPPDKYYVQQPLVTFIDGTGVRAHTTLSMQSVGVDHVGAAGTGSAKQALSKAWPMQFEKTSDWSDLGIDYNEYLYGSVTPQERVAQRPVWRGTIVGKDSSTPATVVDYVPVISSKDKPTISFENEKGTGATVAFSGDVTTGQARITVTGGSNYLTRYNSGDTLVTLQNTKPLSLDSPASVTATVGTAGSVTGVTLTSGGAGYKAPAAYVHGGGGTGAEIAFTHKNGTLTGVALTKAGSGYVKAPTVTIVDSQPIAKDYEIPVRPRNYQTYATYTPTYQIIYLPCVGTTSTLDFVEIADAQIPIDTESIRDRTGVYKGHAFYDTGSVVDARFVYAAENRRSPVFSERHTTAPSIVFTPSVGTAATATTTLVKWHPPVGDGMAIRDTSE